MIYGMKCVFVHGMAPEVPLYRSLVLFFVIGCMICLVHHVLQPLTFSRGWLSAFNSFTKHNAEDHISVGVSVFMLIVGILFTGLAVTTMAMLIKVIKI